MQDREVDSAGLTAEPLDIVAISPARPKRRMGGCAVVLAGLIHPSDELGGLPRICLMLGDKLAHRR